MLTRDSEERFSVYVNSGDSVPRRLTADCKNKRPLVNGAVCAFLVWYVKCPNTPKCLKFFPVLVLLLISSGCTAIQDNSNIKQGLNRPVITKEIWDTTKTEVYSTSNFTTVSFTSKPDGASVFIGSVIGSQLLGKTPVSKRLPNVVDVQEQTATTYQEELRVQKATGAAGLADVPINTASLAITLGTLGLVEPDVARLHSTSDYQIIRRGNYAEYVFPEKVLSNTLTGKIREVVRSKEKLVEFRYEDLVGKVRLVLPEDEKADFDFGTVRTAKTVICNLRLPAKDAQVSVVTPTNAAITKSGSGLLVTPQGLEQDGVGRWWLGGQQLVNCTLAIKLHRTTGQWIPSEDPISIELPRKYTAGSLQLNADVPLTAIPWYWSQHTDWSPVEGTGIDDIERQAWKSKLQLLWSAREKTTNAYGAFLAGLFVKQFSENDVGLRNELGSFLRALADRKINVAFPSFRKVDPATDSALAFEIQEDAIRGLREAGNAHFLFTESSTTPGKDQGTQDPDYVMLVDLVNIGIDTQERIARSAGKVQIGTRKYANPEYYDLLKARVGSEQMLARIGSGSIEANSQASKQEGDALARLLVGGELANRNALSPVDSGGMLLGVMGSLFGADAEKQKAQAYQVQLVQAQSAVSELSRKLASMSEYNEDPIYQDFQTEDRYVVKKALATAYVKVVLPNAPAKELFSRKIISDVTVSDTFEEANPALGKKGKALDLPSDQQMKRDVSTKLTQELSGQIRDGFLFKLGLEYYAQAKYAEKKGDAGTFGESAIQFLLSPAAKAYPKQAHDVSVVLDGLVKRAVQSTQNTGIDSLFGMELKQE